MVLQSHPKKAITGFLHQMFRYPTLPKLRVVVEFERRAETRNVATKKRSGKKARDLLKEYPEEKAKALMARLRAAGMFYFDPDFPGDEEDSDGLGFNMLQLAPVTRIIFTELDNES